MYAFLKIENDKNSEVLDQKRSLPASIACCVALALRTLIYALCLTYFLKDLLSFRTYFISLNFLKKTCLIIVAKDLIFFK